MLLVKKHHDQLFPLLQAPLPEVLAQAALFIVLRDQPTSTTLTPWTTLRSRRFGGDVYDRIITLQRDDTTGDPVTVHVRSSRPRFYDISVQTTSSTTTYNSVPGKLVLPTTLSTMLDSATLRTTIVSQTPPPNFSASSSPNTMERLHVFHKGVKTTLVLPSPKWLLSLGGDILGERKGALRAPMPSVVVEVKVKVGDKVEVGQAIVVLESMKTEMVLRADVTGIVQAVSCTKGEMVEEGTELVDIEG